MTADERLSDIPVIVLSAAAAPEPARAQGFVRKPFALETLVSRSTASWIGRAARRTS